MTVTAEMETELKTLAKVQGTSVRQLIRDLLNGALFNAIDFAPEQHLGFKDGTLDNLATMAELRGRTVRDMIRNYTVAALTADLMKNGLLTVKDTP